MAKILIVDDQPTNRQFLVKLLGYGGHHLLEAADGAEALELCQAKLPDLVICDILMPTMDGFEFVRRLRSNPAIATTAVIFYTATYHQREALSLAQACGVRQVLFKPCKPDAILRAVNEALGGGTMPGPPRPAEGFRREHLALLTDTLTHKVGELEAVNLRLAALIQLGQQVALQHEAGPLLEEFCSATRHILAARYAVAGILAEDGQAFSHFTISGLDAVAAAQTAVPCPRVGLLSQLLQEGAPLRLKGPSLAAAEIGLPPSASAMRSFLGTAVASSRRVYGLLYLADKVGALEFDDGDEQLAITLAAQLAVGYENARLHQELRQRADDLEREVVQRRRAEQRLRLQGSALEAAANGIAITDAAGDTAWVNPAFTRMTGYAPGDVLGRNLRLLKSDKHDRAFFQQLWQTINSGQVWKGEMTNRRKDGSEYVEQQTITPVRNEQGELVNFIAIKEDVTERKRSEQALEERARLAALSGDVGVALTRASTLAEMLGQCAEAMVRNLGAAFARIWTMDPAENVLVLQASAGLYTHLDGKHSRVAVGALKIGRIALERLPHLTNDVLHDARVSDREWARREGMVAFAGYPMLLESRLVGVMAMFARHPLSEDTLNAMAAVANQIAVGIERKRSEESRRAAEERLRHVVATSPAVLFTLAISGDQIQGISWISYNLLAILGHSPEAALGTDWWWGNIHPEDRDRIIGQTHADLLDHGYASHEYRFRHGDGRYRWMRGELRLIRDGAGQPAEVVGSWSDITERKQLEDQFRQAQKMEAVGRLAGGVAHDFNNLLTIINGYGDLVLGGLPADDPARALIVEMVAAGDRAAALTRQLLAFSRKAILEPRILDLKALVADTEKMLRRIIGEDIQLTIVAAPELGAVKADPGQVEQVILNLVVNARDAMPQGGRLTIELSNAELDEGYAQSHLETLPGPCVLLAVSDTGCGMDQATMTRIFEPFFSTKGDRGTGLGLATVHGIVKQSGGHVAVYSEVGYGTTFKVYLPRVEQQVSSPTARFGPAAMPRGSETVLLVEDEDGVRALSRHVLQGCGYTVLEAHDGGEAVRFAIQHQGQIHVVVTDVVMPRMSGRQVAQRVTATHPEAKVLFLSGYTDDAVVRHGILTAEVAFLQKPFSAASLAAKVREVLDR